MLLLRLLYAILGWQCIVMADTLLLFVLTVLFLFSQCVWSHLLLRGCRLLSEYEAGQAWHGGVPQLRVLGGPASIDEGRVHLLHFTAPWWRVWPRVVMFTVTLTVL